MGSRGYGTDDHEFQNLNRGITVHEDDPEFQNLNFSNTVQVQYASEDMNQK